MKILVAGDSFKGSLSAKQFTDGVSDVLSQHGFSCVSLPLCDGGEGTAEILTGILNGKPLKVTVSDALLRPVTATVGMCGETFVAESAQAVGLAQIKKPDVLFSSSFGVGEMLRFCVERGAKHIVLTLGGTACNDGGAGMLCALGGKFFQKDGKEFLPRSGNLCETAQCDLNKAIRFMQQTKVTVLCDVDNPVLGKRGATAVYAPQKGATKEMLPLLEEGMKNFADVAEKATGKSVRNSPGAGSGGGLGFGCMLLNNVTFLQGSEAVLQTVGFDELVKNVDLVITGEGKFDSQSFMGKITGSVIKHSKGKKIGVICGIASVETLRDKNFAFVKEIGKDKPDALKNARHYLADAAEEIADFLSCSADFSLNRR